LWFVGRRALGLILAVCATVVLGLAYEALTWPHVVALARENPSTTAFIERYKERARRDTKLPRLSWHMVSYDAISTHLKRAVIVGEDIDFFSHHGFATEEMKAALRAAWAEKELPRGASTITQQLAKNLWLSPSYNPVRKIKEALLTRQLEERLSKRRILDLYLNVAEFGPGIYGAEAAAQRYFGISATDLDEHQAAALAASLPMPSRWHPGDTSRGYLRYVAQIEGRARKASWVAGLV
jgi:monofunctional biosynthetic peptidoglycan transglycosylase